MPSKYESKESGNTELFPFVQFFLQFSHRSGFVKDIGELRYQSGNQKPAVNIAFQCSITPHIAQNEVL